jgi:branched-chain amino acid transport system ATP-binding protein
MSNNGLAAEFEQLRIRDLNAFYGESHVLHGINLEVHRGELVTLLGRNGAGKTTTLRAILGLECRRSGSITINGQEVINKPSYKVARLGIGYCPEERGIFASLSVEENLVFLPRVGSGGMSLEAIYRIFPNLELRRKSQGTRLSGGEQQMLAMARILRTGAKLLLLDELTEGLAPLLIRMLAEVLTDLKAKGYTILLVEQNFRFASSLADRHYVMETGRVIDIIRKEELATKMDRLETLLCV